MYLIHYTYLKYRVINKQRVCSSYTVAVDEILLPEILLQSLRFGGKI